MLALLRSVFPGFDADAELRTAGGQPLACAQYTTGSTGADNLKEAAAFCMKVGDSSMTAALEEPDLGDAAGGVPGFGGGTG